MTYRDDPWMALCADDRACIACSKKDGTVVACHSNQQTHGKGMGIKAESWVCIPLCASCHFAFDHTMTRETARLFWSQHWALHHMALCQAELIAPVGMEERERKPAKLLKILPRNSDRPWPPRAA